MKSVKTFTLILVALFCSINALYSCKKTANLPISEAIPNDFNGVVYLEKDGEVIYDINQGYSNFEEKVSLKNNDLFVVGSISKQITAALVIRAKEEGVLSLHDPIDKYLTDLSQEWKSKVMIHHLLTHRHGITSLTDSLAFELDSQFQYSQIGYGLLSNILEVVYKDSFENISKELFTKLGMSSTFHPASISRGAVVRSYIQDTDGNTERAINNYPEYVAAGGFISNTEDMARWNRLLHQGKIVSEESLRLMTQKYAVRNHPIFGEVNYGYGLLFLEGEENIQIGALGYAPGFVSASYYYPQTGYNLIILSNKAVNLDDFKVTFATHTTLMDLVKAAK